MTETVLDVEPRGDGVILLTLDRPAKRNALNAELRRSIADRMGTLRDDDDCRAVVLAGAGGTFCAGFDLKELQESASPEAIFADANAYHRAVHTFPKPIVAAIIGSAVAGGLDLALMCDVRIAHQSATFGQPQVRFGVPASFELLRSVVTDATAREPCLTGRVIDSAEALRIGLVHRVVGHDAIDEAVTVAATIAAVPATEAMKRQFTATQPDLFGAAGNDPV